jgi:hypothetical protein
VLIQKRPHGSAAPAQCLVEVHRLGISRASSQVVRLLALTTLLALYGAVPSRAQDDVASAPPPTWQNPDIGVVADMVVDAHDVEGDWRTSGFRMRALELEVSSNIDPYAKLTANVFVAPEGAELHELYTLFHDLPGGMKLKAGQMLAGFGRWSRFHPHFMPFASEPRLLQEYAGGGLLLTGAELSWLLPFSHYVEANIGVYNTITGHSHDHDPVAESAADPLTPAGIAAEEGCVPHGDHYDCGRGILYDEDLLALRGLDGRDPKNRFSNRRADELAFGGRVNTTVEFGLDWSLDFGVSGLYQHAHKRSQRLDGIRYSKALAGLDATLFWHPLSQAKYRGLDLGVELLANREGFETVVSPTLTREEYLTRAGGFGHVRWRQNESWHFGAFGEAFQARQGDAFLKRRGGVFATYNITHYQYLRLEYNRFEAVDGLAATNRVLLQYDAVIGYHTHGAQR